MTLCQIVITYLLFSQYHTIHKVDTALFKYLADKKICSLYAEVHLIKGSIDCKVLMNEGKHGMS